MKCINKMQIKGSTAIMQECADQLDWTEGVNPFGFFFGDANLPEFFESLVKVVATDRCIIKEDSSTSSLEFTYETEDDGHPLLDIASYLHDLQYDVYATYCTPTEIGEYSSWSHWISIFKREEDSIPNHLVEEWELKTIEE